MNKTLIALAVLAGFAGAAAAQSSVTLSGSIDAGLRSVNNDKSVTNAGSGRNNVTFAGTEDLGNGNSAFFSAQHRFNLNGTQNGQNAGYEVATSGAASGQSATVVFWRQLWVGLKNKDIGDVRLGRMLLPEQELNGNYTAFGTDTVGQVHIDGRTANDATASLRTNSTIYARSASFSGVVIHAAVAGVNENRVSSANASTQRAQGFAVEFNQGPASATLALDRNPLGLKTLGVFGKYDLGAAVLFAQYESNSDVTVSTATNPTDKRFSVSARVPYGAFTGKIGYLTMNRSDPDRKSVV